MMGFKVFNPNWKCIGFQYEVGKTFKHNGKIKPCESGFHFCKHLLNCFKYYCYDSRNKFAIVEATGNIATDDDIKYVTDEIKIIRELSWNEVLALCNTGNDNIGQGNAGNYNSGNWNSGDYNSGICNTGDHNSGDWNTGHRNTGNYNSGNWNSGSYNSGSNNSGEFNSGSYNSGFFNNNTLQTFSMFNKNASVKLLNEVLNNEGYISFKRNFTLIEWVEYKDMTNEEKSKHPDAENIGGYLKQYMYKKACKKSWNLMTNEEKEEFMKLPNFDPEVFKDITRIDINECIDEPTKNDGI